ncbi:unnamed protein product [Menidia menidia]|uniref:(Atlantic silverside) hypothetical protein n=1 Tax=Menidia menidia TaxID=238744 RepID=A0A8S4AGD9_9TELE|nr:unnamed protein product [Menidia menidia]
MTNLAHNENERSLRRGRRSGGVGWRGPALGLLLWASCLPPARTALAELPMPINISLNPNHYNYILKWDPGPDTPKGTYYNVSIETERVSPIPVCERVQHPLMCNLTEAFSDPMETYTAAVTAVLGAQFSEPTLTEGFTPIKFMPPPLLTVTSCGTHLCVDLWPPQQRFLETYNNMHYQLKIKSNEKHGGEFFTEIWTLKRKVLQTLARGSEYCVSVRFLDQDIPEAPFSQSVCAFTPGLFPSDALTSTVLCIAVFLCVVVLALLFYTGFICLRKKPMPTVLTSIQHLEELLAAAHPASVLKTWPTGPSKGDKSLKLSLSDDSDEEFATESTSESSKRGYKVCVGNGLSSSSDFLAPLSPEPGLPSPDLLDGTRPQTSGETASGTPVNGLPADSLNAEQREKEMSEENAGWEVNLLTLTFGRPEEEQGGEQEESLHQTAELDDVTDAEEYHDPPPPPHKAAAEAESCPVTEEEEEEEDSGYMERIPADVREKYLLELASSNPSTLKMD